MPRQRDYRAEYLARAARAKQLGYTGNRDRTIARKEARTGNVGRLKPADTPRGLPPTIAQAAKLKRNARNAPKVVQMPALPDTKVIYSRDQRFVLAELRKAAAADLFITIGATVQTSAGYRHREISGYTAGVSNALGGGGAGAGGGGGGDIVGRLQMLVGPTERHKRGGIRAADLLAYLEDYDSVWEGLSDLFDSEY